MAGALAVDDLLRIAVLHDVAISPDGLLAAITVRAADLAANGYHSTIHIYAVDGGASWPLTGGTNNDWAPTWSPDGTMVAFLSDRGGSAQVWLTAPRGERRQLTNMPEGVAERPAWSPDGRSMVIVVWQETASNTPDDRHTLEVAAGTTEMTRLCYRLDGMGYLGTRYHHIWIVDAASGAAYPLTTGTTDNFSPTWSPDGNLVAFVSNRYDERLIDFRSALWVTPCSGGVARRVTPELGVALAPAWSPDGRYLAYSGLPDDRGYGANHRLCIASPDDVQPPRALTDDPNFEGHAGGSLTSDVWQTGSGSLQLHWAPDGGTIYFVAARRARSHIFAADLTGRVRALVEGDRACSLLGLSGDGRTLVFAAADPAHAADLFVLPLAPNASPRRLSSLNPWLDGAALDRPIAFTTTSADGRAVDAWLIPPARATRPSPGPLVLYVHGGPHSIFGYTFFFDAQLLAAQGYAVLYVNPRATRSYGDDFARCNLGHWGEGDTPDLLAALDHAVTLGWVDAARVGVIGLSYGGYMVNWLIGHCTRFRAAVSENSISNLLSAYGTSDGGWYFMPLELGAEPEEDAARYARLSPISAADRIEAPLLLLHCEDDFSCPIEQGEQLYIALKRRGKTVEMVRFAGEGHLMLLNGKLAARVARRRHILRWFERHL